MLLRKWIIGKRILEDLSSENNKSVDTLRKLFKKFLNNPPPVKIKLNNNCHLIIDGTYFKNNFCLLDYLDNDLKYLQLYKLVERENFFNYAVDLEILKQSGLNVVSITSDGQKGLIKAIKLVFPEIIHQRCVVHIQRMSLIYLTRFPKTNAGIDLRILVKEIHKIDSYEKKDLWIERFES